MLYVSFEQETQLNDHFPDRVPQDRLDYGWVVISQVPWGAEGPERLAAH
jgi:hypothetical protein